MARLKKLQPRLSTLSPRLKAEPAGKRNERERDAAAPWRKWYKTAEWRKLRAKVIKRDLNTCQKTGVVLIGKYPAPNSGVVDHIKPHRGNPELFWDENNLQLVSKEYHDTVKQALEQDSLHMRGNWD